ncbi:uncharacterized protein BP01DRAFT_155172 [Aspergillus saccharolyticus JOP 1030-1]|uniref:Uncharacterized protein n=1 Tax=Aspergillus saccharolyticus JOP 1030-1 TaxID=1450539 RepID=A0A318Z4A5_9EURO|nr:hypothetical protein BP01DRAFT_155172 [Aspergillus saccharolyticus JOP 1030-1]PYH41916.1 hypothetical protein BP01DRAFT_155172 [Aspergillus saccharolyticus JOP 1030-1]
MKKKYWRGGGGGRGQEGGGPELGLGKKSCLRTLNNFSPALRKQLNQREAKSSIGDDIGAVLVAAIIHCLLQSLGNFSSPSKSIPLDFALLLPDWCCNTKISK